MEQKLTDAQALALNAVAIQRDLAMAQYKNAIGEMVAVWAPNIKKGQLVQRPDGFYIVSVEGKQEEEAAAG